MLRIRMNRIQKVEASLNSAQIRIRQSEAMHTRAHRSGPPEGNTEEEEKEHRPVQEVRIRLWGENTSSCSTPRASYQEELLCMTRSCEQGSPRERARIVGECSARPSLHWGVFGGLLDVAGLHQHPLLPQPLLGELAGAATTAPCRTASPTSQATCASLSHRTSPSRGGARLRGLVH